MGGDRADCLGYTHVLILGHRIPSSTSKCRGFCALTVLAYQKTSQWKQLFHALKYDTPNDTAQCQLISDPSDVMRQH